MCQYRMRLLTQYRYRNRRSGTITGTVTPATAHTLYMRENHNALLLKRTFTLQ